MNQTESRSSVRRVAPPLAGAAMLLILAVLALSGFEWFAALGLCGLAALYIYRNLKLRRHLEERVEERISALQSSEQRLKVLLDNLPGTVYRCLNDEAWTMLFISEAVERLTGYPASDFIENRVRTFESVIHPDDAGEVATQVESALQDDRPWEIEYRIVSEDGAVYWVGETGRGIRGDDGKVVFLDGVIIDITRRKEMEAELLVARDQAEAASRAKGNFLANMRHEIPTPMNAILGMLELLEGTELTPDQQEFSKIAVQSAEDLLRIINDILDFSKVEAGKLDLHVSSFELRDFLSRLLHTFAPSASKKGTELLMRIEPDVPDLLEADTGRLRQILVNLVGNAVKFTPAGEILVAVRKLGEIERNARGRQTLKLEFTISDTGIGIPDKVQETIFEAFSQADPSMTREFGGTGLGLAISRSLTELMGGEIDFESVADEGTTFRLSLDIGIPNDPERPPIATPAPGLGARALVVDDNASSRQILAEMLEASGLRVSSSPGAEPGIEMLNAAVSDGAPFRVLFIDHEMLGTDGITLGRTISEDTRFGSPAMVLLTTSVVPNIEDGGFLQRLAKPVNPSELATLLGEVTAEENDGSAVPASPSDGDGAEALKVLVVDDNRVNQKVATYHLESKGHRVEVAENGRMALELIDGGGFDLILMDIQMPVMDGIEATREIRRAEQSKGSHIPIIATTARALKGDSEECLDAGMDDYISKPIQSDQLFAVIARTLVRLNGT